MNPYIEELQQRTQETGRGEWENVRVGKETPLRRELVDKYAWAIPNDEAIDTLCNYSPILEIGCGNGFWASRIRGFGGEVTAIDADPPNDTWTRVQKGTHNSIPEYDEHSLFLCWPSNNQSWTKEAVEMYEGNTLIYIGEGHGGNTGSCEFHETVSRKFGLADEVIDIPSWQSVSDKMYVFEAEN